MTKPTLEEMAEACLEEAFTRSGRLKRLYREFPNSPPDPKRERDVVMWEAMGEIFAIGWRHEDEFRRFIAGLMAKDKAAR